MKKIALVLLAMLLLAGCGKQEEENQVGQAGSYVSIKAEAAKKLMDEEPDCIILDVRTRQEYESGHIPGALLMPNEEIRERAEAELTDKAQLILVYCRSGNRSKQASEALVEMGYTNVREFGGINDWPYDIE